MSLKKIIAGLILIFFIPAAYGISLGVSGGEGSASGSLTIKLDAEDDALVASQISVNGAEISPAFRSSGRIRIFEQDHQVTDRADGKHAETYVKVVNGRGIKYSSKVLPAEGIVFNQPWVSAEEWLDVASADSIRCIAFANYKDQHAAVLTDVLKGSIHGYHNIAYASEGYVMAGQEVQDSHRRKGITGQEIVTAAWSYNGIDENADAIVNVKEGSLKAFRNDAHATSDIAEASITGLDALGTVVEVIGYESKGLDWYSLRADLFGTKRDPAKYKGDVNAISGQETTQFVTSATGNDVIVEDIRDKAGIQQRVALQSKDGSFSGIARSSDSGQIIQDTINIAENDDAIKIAEGIYEGNNIIDRSLSIEGAGAGITIIDGGGINRVFAIGVYDPNINVTLENMTIQNGYADKGAGILNAGSLKVKNSEINGNTAYEYGSGIWSSGTLYVDGSTISNNGNPRDGGGIWNSGALNVKNSQIYGNTANWNGGGLWNSGTMNVDDSYIFGNTAYLYGGGIANDLGTSIVEDSVIFGNNAGGGGGIYNIFGMVSVKNSSLFANAADNGGGILNNGELAVDDCTISGNIANAKAGGVFNMGTATLKDSMVSENSANFGGGIWSDATINLNNVSVDYNSAIFGGGAYNAGTMNINRGRISNNIADVSGGIYNYYGIVNLNGGSIDHNTASVSGGIDNFYGTVNLSDGSISNNIAYWGGGVINGGTMNINSGSIDSNRANYGGGGIYNTAGGTVNMIGGSISNNTATYNGGGIINTNSGILNLDGGSINNNTAYSGGGISNELGTTNLNGGSISNNTAVVGGGIYNTYSGIVNLYDGSIDHNNATAPSPSGGGIYNDGAVITGDTELVHDNTPDQIVP